MHRVRYKQSGKVYQRWFPDRRAAEAFSSMAHIEVLSREYLQVYLDGGRSRAEFARELNQRA